jgi:hypothetical protein
MARRRHGYLARLASLLLCAATVAGWAVTRELHANAVKEAGERYDTFFAAQEGRLGDVGMRACLANQLGKHEAATLVGKPEFKPNYFLTCAVQYSYDMGVLAQIGIDGHVARVSGDGGDEQGHSRHGRHTDGAREKQMVQQVQLRLFGEGW